MQPSQNARHAEFLKNLSISSLTSMQEEVVQKAATTEDLLVLAPTGSGKTLSFLIPVIDKLNPASREVQALIVAPSRELSLQIEQVLRSMKTSYKVSCVYGGHSVKIEQNSLSEAPAIIIGTPGRLADHIRRKSFDPSYIRLLVLDEFDKSLQMGFQEELKVVFAALNGRQQHILTSATRLDPLPDLLPFKKIETLNYLKDEAESKLKLKLVNTRSVDKIDTLLRLVAKFNQEVCSCVLQSPRCR
ncbi:MAG: DEAD/DEAH box helicase [Bacteroidota bacterium]